MTKKDLASFRRSLLAERNGLAANLGARFETVAGMGRVSEEDLAPLSHEEFISLRVNGLDYAKLRLVDEALDRLSSGEYGICLHCDEPVPPKRLQAIPWARYCLHCQDLLAAPDHVREGPAEVLEPVGY